MKLVGIFLWLLVFITAALSYTAVNYSDNERLVELCNEDNHSPQNMRDSELDQLLNDLNKLRLSNVGASNNLKWIDSCAGWVMVEMKSRIFEKKLPLPKSAGKR